MKTRIISIAAISVIFLLIGILKGYSIDDYIYKKIFSNNYTLDDVDFKIMGEVKHKILEKEEYGIHYFVSGDKNSETIIFLHPAFGDHQCFDKQIDYFAQDFRVITIDILGHGTTGAAKTKDKTISTHQHIKEIMEKEDIDKTHIVGVSLGSLLAQDFAIKHPDKILSLTGMGGYSINREQKDLDKYHRKISHKFIFRLLFSMDSFRKYVAASAVENDLEQKRFYKSAKHFTRKSLKHMSGLNKLPQARPNFERNHPLLILVGEKDDEMAIKKAREWHSEEPKSQLYTIDNAGHCANMDNAEMFNKILMAFIKEHTEISRTPPITVEKEDERVSSKLQDAKTEITK